MQKKVLVSSAVLLALSLILSLNCVPQEKQPPVVTALEGQAPSDAVVLFDGTDLSEWIGADGEPANWIVADGAMTVNKGDIITRKTFGDMQIHLEFATPASAKGEGQDRGNSGVYIHGNYEVQILDSYRDETCNNSMCGAIYKLSPPLVNASRPPGLWQVYDIIFRAPGFDSEGKVIKKAAVTVLHNDKLIQDHVEVVPTGARTGSEEIPCGPIKLQDHNHPVKFRNIWVREL